MRIALVHNLPSGGAKRALYDFTRGLKDRGHRLDLFIPDSADESFLPLAPLVGRVSVFPSPVPLRISFRAPLLSGYILLLLRLRHLSLMNRVYGAMAKAIARGGYDFAFVHPCSFFKVPLILSHLTIPSVFFCQEHYRELYEIPPGIVRRGGFVETWYRPAEWLHNRLLRKRNREGIRAATLVLANSSYQADILHRIYDIRPTVVHLGVDTGIFHPMPGIRRENNVLSVGMLSPYKGHDFVIDALSRIESGKRPELIVAANSGGESTRERLTREAADKGVRMRIIMDTVGMEGLARLYNRTRVLCCAQIREPFGLVAIEAMACGTPVVGVGEGGIRESIVDGKTGVVTDRNEADFAKALSRVLGDAALWNRLSAGGIEAVNRYWNRDAACERLLSAVATLGLR